MNHLKLGVALAFAFALVGCAELIPTPKDQAVQIDFGNHYMASLSAKYKSTGADSGNPKFSEKLDRYDALATFDSDVDQRKIDRERKLQLDGEILKLSTELARTSGEISYIQAQKQLVQERVKDLASKLGKTTDEVKAEKIKDEVGVLQKNINEINANIIVLESQKASFVADIEAKRSELKKLIDTKYDTSESIRRAIRDEIIRDFIAIADNNYLLFKNDLLAGKVRTDTIADISELLLSTATTLTGGVMSKTNLGAASTLIKGGRSTVDKNYFAQQTMRAIINAMEEGRAADKTIIVRKMSQPTGQYPLSEAISDVQRYQSRASLFLAVLDLANQSGASAAVAEDRLQQEVKRSAK